MIYNGRTPELIKGRIWLTVLLIFALFGVVNVFTPNADLIIASHVMRLSASAVVVYVYWPEAWAGVRAAEPERSDYLIVGIVFSFLSNMLQSLFSLIGRMGGLPKWWLDSQLVGPTLLLSVLAAVLHVSAPDAVKKQVPKRNRIAMGFAFGATILAVASLGVTQPDIGPYLEKARPYLQGTAATDSATVRPM